MADALTTAGSVFKAMGLDGQDVADDLLEKLSAAQQDMDQMAEVFRSLQNVMNGASSLLAASAITISDAQSTMNSTSTAVGSTVQPDARDSRGFAAFMKQYIRCLAVERAAIDALP